MRLTLFRFVLFWTALCAAVFSPASRAVALAQAAAPGQNAASAVAAPATPSPPPKQPRQTDSLDRQAIVKYLRNLYGLFSDQIRITVGAAQASPIPGLRQAKVEITKGKATGRETIYVSADGRYLFLGTVHPLNQDPFLAIRREIDIQDQPSIGPANAPVTLVEYSDFECPYCKKMSQMIHKQVPELYGGKVRIVFKNFPLVGLHPWAMRAALAGRAVYKLRPDLFWDFYDWMFKNQDSITVKNVNAKVSEFAQQNGLDPAKLRTAMDAPGTAAAVNRSVQEGHKLGVRSTPTMFVNGRPLVGSMPFNRLKAVLDWELKKVQPATPEEPAAAAKPLPEAKP